MAPSSAATSSNSRSSLNIWPESATRIVLIRHGESQCTVDGVVGGDRGCTGLSDEGRRQCGQLRERLLRTGELAGTDVVLTSVLPRAIETAELIAPGLGK